MKKLGKSATITRKGRFRIRGILGESDALSSWGRSFSGGWCNGHERRRRRTSAAQPRASASVDAMAGHAMRSAVAVGSQNRRMVFRDQHRQPLAYVADDNTCKFQQFIHSKITHPTTLWPVCGAEWDRQSIRKYQDFMEIVHVL